MTTMLIACVILAAVAMLPAVAHALELPGKMRLERDVYLAVQRIYYPGFTIAGFGELAAVVASLVVLPLAPRGSVEYWLSSAAFIALFVMHAVYWMVTRPVNKFWMNPEQLGAAGKSFFSAGREGGLAAYRVDDAARWTELRNRWEYSHVVRAILAALAFVALVIALSRAGE
jgi:hypothetical protein